VASGLASRARLGISRRFDKNRDKNRFERDWLPAPSIARRAISQRVTARTSRRQTTRFSWGERGSEEGRESCRSMLGEKAAHSGALALTVDGWHAVRGFPRLDPRHGSIFRDQAIVVSGLLRKPRREERPASPDRRREETRGGKTTAGSRGEGGGAPYKNAISADGTCANYSSPLSLSLSPCCLFPLLPVPVLFLSALTLRPARSIYIPGRRADG